MEETIKILGSAGTAWYFFVISAIFIICMVFTLLKMRGQKKRVSTWLKENPNTVQVYKSFRNKGTSLKETPSKLQ